MMGEVEYEIDFLFDILLTQRCCFDFHKNRTSNMAGGHRHSLRRNVCHPATMRTHTHTIKKYMQHFKYKKRYLPFLQLISTAICEEFSSRNP